MQIQRDVPLDRLTTLGVGGHAKYFARAESVADVAQAVARATELGVPLLVLGGGSNLVVGDTGVNALVLEMALRGIEQSGNTLRAFAGEPWDDFVKFAVERGLQGLECLSGIPGSIGATPIQNVGAYGQEVSETIGRVQAFDRKFGREVSFSRAECEFGYRDSRFKSREPERYIVLEAVFELRSDAPPSLRYAELERHLAANASPTLADVRAAVIELRRNKSMVIDPSDENRRSCGSFFVNPVVSAEQVSEVRVRVNEPAMPEFPQPDGRTKLSAAWLIQKAGLERGLRRGAAGLSSRHTLALVAHEGACARDVVELAHHVRRTVRQRFGVTLVPEPSFWGFGDFDAGLPKL